MRWKEMGGEVGMEVKRSVSQKIAQSGGEVKVGCSVSVGAPEFQAVPLELGGFRHEHTTMHGLSNVHAPW